jgi:bacillithiol biosynthesis cysteine-adding enzyme BshC
MSNPYNEILEFRDIGGYSKLFLDYISEYSLLEQFFSGDPYTEKTYVDLITKIDSKEYDRGQLAEILRNQNQEFTDNEMMMRQKNKMIDPRCTVVITGQQAGLFLGPMYAIYKALTAIRLAEALEKALKRPFVPVFWLEVDDHDFDEVRSFNLLSPGGELKNFQYTDSEVSRALPVKNRQISDDIESVINEISGVFGNAENASGILEDISRIYKKGQSFPEVFIRFFREYFPNQAILFINPGDPEFKKLAVPFFEKAIFHAEDIRRKITKNSRLLRDCGYHVQAQVSDSKTRLFHVVDGERLRLSPEIVTKNKLSGIEKFVNENYTDLSPDVLLRPLLQDYVFPTVVYVAGPSEIAYLAQLKEVYNLLKIEMPVIYPRWSGTIADTKTIKFISGSGSKIGDLLSFRSSDVVNNILKDRSDIDIDPLFDSAGESLRDSLNEIRLLSKKLDKSLLGFVDQSENKMIYQLDKVRNRFENALKTNEKTTYERIRRIQNRVKPGEVLQERVFSILNYLLRYGKYFADFIAKNVSTDSFNHKIIEYKQNDR